MRGQHLLVTVAAILIFAALGCGGSSNDDPDQIHVAYVTNGIDPFWYIAAAGTKAGAKDFDVDCEARYRASCQMHGPALHSRGKGLTSMTTNLAWP